MLDVKTTLVSELQTATSLPVYYELICDSSTAKPCITYQETNNYDIAVGDTLGYSRIQFTLKLWGGSISNLMAKAVLMDAKMRQLGYRKDAYNELNVDGNICLIFTYSGLGQETYTN